MGLGSWVFAWAALRALVDTLVMLAPLASGGVLRNGLPFRPSPSGRVVGVEQPGQGNLADGCRRR